MGEPIKTCHLNNGLLLRFYDQSNRYYGDFHRICIRVTAEISVDNLIVPADLENMQSLLPELIGFERRLEKMGVTSEDLAQVKEALMEDFAEASIPYLEKPKFIERLLRKRIAEMGKMNKSTVFK